MTKKIRLDAESLKVETFGTDAAEGDRATVFAHMVTNRLLSDCANTCEGCATYSCGPIQCA
jgi:hypothetical protein